MTTPKKSYTSGHFELQIDGRPTTAYLKTLDGGWGKQALIDERIGPENQSIKHASVFETDPFSFEFGLSGANAVLAWIQASWRKDPARHDGQITHADFNLKPTFTHEFSQALITETTFPTLDGASKEAAYIKVKCQPFSTAVSQGGSGSNLRANHTQKQKLWLCSGFRLNIDGIDEMKYTNKIESFTIKQGVKKMYMGQFREPEIVPTKIEFPNISGTISLGHATGLLEWYKKYVQKGQDDPGAQKTGSIEFLSPNKSDVIFRINLFEVGLMSTAILASTANADQIKRVKFELYVGRMELDTGALGLG
jgi:T4-like virus tail tube protein gp19